MKNIRRRVIASFSLVVSGGLLLQCLFIKKALVRLASSLGWLSITFAIALLGACGGGETPNEAKDTPAAIAMAGTALMPFEMTSVTVSNASLMGSTYVAQIDGIDVTLIKIDNEIWSLMVPDVSVGPHTLSLKTENQVLTASFTVTSAPTIADPSIFLDQFSAELLAKIDSVASAAFPGSSRSTSVEELAALRRKTSAQLDMINDLSGEQKLELAHFINSNITAAMLTAEAKVFMPENRALTMSAISANALLYSESECKRKLAFYVNAVFKTRLLTRKIAILLAASAATVGTPLVFVSPVALGVAIGVYVSQVVETIRDQEQVLDVCVTKVGDDILSAMVNSSQGTKFVLSGQRAELPAVSATGGGALIFSNGSARKFDIITTMSMSDASIFSTSKEFVEDVMSVLGELPSGWVPTSWWNVIRPVSLSNSTIVSDPSSYTIGVISDSNIVADTKAIAGQISIEFNFRSSTLSDANFSFDLIDGRDGKVTKFFAILKSNLIPSSLVLNFDWTKDQGGVIKPKTIGLTEPINYSVNGRAFGDVDVLTGLGEGYYVVVARDKFGLQSTEQGILVTKVPYFVNSIIGKRWKTSIGQKSCKPEYEYAIKISEDSVRVMYGCGVSGTTGQIFKFYPILSHNGSPVAVNVIGYGVSGISTYNGFIIDYKLLSFSDAYFDMYSEYLESQAVNKGHSTWSEY